jgi:hypothetical protein
MTGGSAPDGYSVRDAGAVVFAVLAADGVAPGEVRFAEGRRCRVVPPGAEAVGLPAAERGAVAPWHAVRPPAASSVQAVAVTVRAGGRSAIGFLHVAAGHCMSGFISCCGYVHEGFARSRRVPAVGAGDEHRRGRSADVAVRPAHGVL